MKMSMDIDPQLLEQVKSFSGESAQATAINTALKEWVRLKKIQQLQIMIDEQPFEFSQTAKELRALNGLRAEHT